MALFDALAFVFFVGDVTSTCWGHHSPFLPPVDYCTSPSFTLPFFVLTAVPFRALVCCFLSFGWADLGVDAASWQTSFSRCFIPFLSRRLILLCCWHGRIWIACLTWRAIPVCYPGTVFQSISWCWPMSCRLWVSFTTWSEPPLWNDRSPTFGRRKCWLFHRLWFWCPWLWASWWGRWNTSNICLCLRWYPTVYCARFFGNWICLMSSSLCTSCHGCIASFTLGSCLCIRCIVAWLRRRNITLPHRWWGPLLLHTRRWTLWGRWFFSSIPLLWLIVVLLLHCMWWYSRGLCWRVDRTYTCCRRWRYNTPPRGWWHWCVYWCVLPWSG